jgi:hypothetical protein
VRIIEWYVNKDRSSRVSWIFFFCDFHFSTFLYMMAWSIKRRRARCLVCDLCVLYNSFWTRSCRRPYSHAPQAHHSYKLFLMYFQSFDIMPKDSFSKNFYCNYIFCICKMLDVDKKKYWIPKKKVAISLPRTNEPLVKNCLELKMFLLLWPLLWSAWPVRILQFQVKSLTSGFILIDMRGLC